MPPTVGTRLGHDDVTRPEQLGIRQLPVNLEGAMVEQAGVDLDKALELAVRNTSAAV